MENQYSFGESYYVKRVRGWISGGNYPVLSSPLPLHSLLTLSSVHLEKYVSTEALVFILSKTNFEKTQLKWHINKNISLINLRSHWSIHCLSVIRGFLKLQKKKKAQCSNVLCERQKHKMFLTHQPVCFEPKREQHNSQIPVKLMRRTLAYSAHGEFVITWQNKTTPKGSEEWPKYQSGSFWSAIVNKFLLTYS